MSDVSPPSNYNLAIGTLITAALRKLGQVDAEATPTDAQFDAGMEAANLLLKGWQADGINLFRQTQLALTIPAMGGGPDTPVVISPRVTGMESARWVVAPGSNQYERPLGRFAYEDYFNLPNKLSATSSGPSVWMLDNQPRASNLHLWPVPQFGGTLKATVARTIENVTAVDDEVQVPSEWEEGFIYTLADRLLDENAVALMDAATAERISERATAFYTKLLNFDRPTAVRIKPEGQAGRRRYWR